MLNIKKLREDKGISQQRLAEAIKVSRSTVAMWETGGSQPDIEMLIRMSLFFSVSVDYLLGRVDVQSPTDNLIATTLSSQDNQTSQQEQSLMNEIADLNDEELQDVLDYIRFKKSKRQSAFMSQDIQLAAQKKKSASPTGDETDIT